MNARASENYLAISCSSSASKSVEIFRAEIYLGRLFWGAEIKCVLRIFWQTWLHIYWRIKKNSTLCKHVPCNTLTHSTNEDLLNIKRKGDPEVSYPLSYVQYHWNPEPVCNKSHCVSLFYLYWYFFNLLNLFWHTDKNFCFYAETERGEKKSNAVKGAISLNR
jgi:hypothetical protein